MRQVAQLAPRQEKGMGASASSQMSTSLPPEGSSTATAGPLSLASKTIFGIEAGVCMLPVAATSSVPFVRAACVVFPGTNGERETRGALESLGLAVIDVDDRQDDLPPDLDLVVLPGGFAHGDALRAGALAARAPVMRAVGAHAAAGRLVLGICNGFQILCEAGLLPGALLPNVSGRFVARDALVIGSGLLAAVIPRALRLPVAHATGRYHLAEAERADAEKRGFLALRYASGTDPNGAEEGVAGVVGGPRSNVVGMMPHPERRIFAGPSDDGRLFFEAILRYDRQRP